MKILIYVWSLNNGGAERVASLWAQGFAQQGHNVSVMLGSFQSRTDYNLHNIKIFRQSPIYDIWQKCMPQCIRKIFFSSRICDLLYNVLPDFVKNWFTSKIVKKINPDVIIVVAPGLYNRVKGAINICKLNIPIVVTDHDAFERPEYAPFSKNQYFEMFVASQKYDFLTILTEADKLVLKDKMEKSFLDKVHVLPNPLTFEVQKNVPLKKKIILAAGRLDAWHYKGFDLLLKAWAKIQSEFPQWKLQIAGGGKNSFLLKMCSDLDIVNRVDFLGFVDIKNQYEHAEVFVLSSRYEAFGMVLTEAMSQGCACIACDFRGRQREIITNENQGIICPTDDENAIAEALQKVLQDDEYRHNLQVNAIERSKYYELPNIMNRWNDIFKEMHLIG